MGEYGHYKNASTARRAAVEKARANERDLVLQGKGTRNWSKAEQAEIIATGKCKGYQGHHKMSVKDHPEYAADPNNIQFLNKKEHLDAHKGDYKNDPKGHYSPETGRINRYADNKPHPEKVKKLSEPLNEKEINEARKAYDNMKAEQAAKRKADYQAKKSVEAREVSRRSYQKKGTDKGKDSRRAEAARRGATGSKALQNSRARAPSGESAGKGRGSQALAAGRTSSGRPASPGSGTASGGRSSSAGHGTSGGHGSSGGGHGTSGGGHGSSGGGRGTSGGSHSGGHGH